MDWFLYDSGLRHERVKACTNKFANPHLAKSKFESNIKSNQFSGRQCKIYKKTRKSKIKF